MPETREGQSQPRTGGYDNPQGGPQVGAEAPAERGTWDRPSDTQAAHALDEGSSVRDPRLAADTQGGARQVGFRAGEASPLQGEYGRQGVDAEAAGRPDPGLSNAGNATPSDPESFTGTDRLTAGAEFADRMPEASHTRAEDVPRTPPPTEDDR